MHWNARRCRNGLCIWCWWLLLLPRRGAVGGLGARRRGETKWPAVKVEQYTTTSRQHQQDDDVIYVLRANAWKLDLVPSSVNYTVSMKECIEAAHQRFQAFLQPFTPVNEPDSDAQHPYSRNKRRRWARVWYPEYGDIVTLRGIRIEICTATTRLRYGLDESYDLRIPSDDYITTDAGDASTVASGSSWIEITAATVYGALHGLETLKQLLVLGWMEDEIVPVYVVQPTTGASTGTATIPLYLYDAPAYPFRGFLMDTVRHFLPLSLILSNLAVMAAHKLNVLHWHLTDAQSWPYQSRAFPELSIYGAWCRSHHRRDAAEDAAAGATTMDEDNSDDCAIYTRHDIQIVIRHAALLGIRVIVEIDLPGHTQGW
jgi:Glycosyl hydrolase family 20, catalytic domain/beta-acetyl hexosaminidase like